MTNFDIITNAAIEAGIYTEEQIKEMISKGGDVPLHTFKEWQRIGYQVRKGEHAKLTCYIWRMNNKTSTMTINGIEQENDESHYYKTKAFFFTAEQVDKITVSKAV